MANSKNYVLVFKLPLLPLRSFKTLSFKGNNILNFLEKYKDLYNDYKVTFNIRRERIMRHIMLSLKDLIKIILEY
jgi:predicted PolB exonuclease-like 3'-5' exonuclease